MLSSSSPPIPQQEGEGDGKGPKGKDTVTWVENCHLLLLWNVLDRLPWGYHFCFEHFTILSLSYWLKNLKVLVELLNRPNRKLINHSNIKYVSELMNESVPIWRKKSLFTFAKKINSLVSPAFPRLNAKRPGSLVDLAKNFCLPWFECQSARHKGKNFEEHVRWRHKSCKVNTLRLRIFVSFNCSEIFVIDLIWSEIPLYILCLIAVLLLKNKYST